jgi:hypothetical protein
MSKTGGHTPGHWTWRGKDGGLYQEGTTHPFGDAVLVPVYEYDSGVDTVVSEADRALIAAAPDLLEALQVLFASYKALADSGDAGNWKIENQPEGKQALAAIAKATGSRP